MSIIAPTAFAWMADVAPLPSWLQDSAWYMMSRGPVWDDKSMMPGPLSHLTVMESVYCALIFISCAILSEIILRFCWKNWTLFAFIWTAFYFLGGLRFMPWKTPFQKALSSGIFVGTTIAMVEWFLRL
jgi:hypothetical protein